MLLPNIPLINTVFLMTVLKASGWSLTQAIVWWHGRTRIGRMSGEVRMTVDAGLPQQICPDGVGITLKLQRLALSGAADVPAARLDAHDCRLVSEATCPPQRSI